MSYHFQGLGAAYAPGFSPPKWPPWLYNAEFWNKDIRGIGSRCPQAGFYGCPCPDGFKLAVPSQYEGRDPFTSGFGTPIQGHLVKDYKTKKDVVIPGLFRCEPYSTCELGQKRYQATLTPYAVRITPTKKNYSTGVVTAASVAYRADKPVTRDFCFDKDYHSAPGDGKLPPGFAGGSYTCAQLLQLLTACKNQRSSTCDAVRQMEGNIRLNCAAEGGQEEGGAVKPAEVEKVSSKGPLIAVSILALGGLALYMTRKKPRRR